MMTNMIKDGKILLIIVNDYELLVIMHDGQSWLILAVQKTQSFKNAGCREK